MDQAALQRYERAVPRYTSYPTAAQFHAGIDAATFGAWLRALPCDEAVSLYVHVPFCRAICWYCACHTRLARASPQFAAYAGLLERELEQLERDKARVARERPIRPNATAGDGLL